VILSHSVGLSEGSRSNEPLTRIFHTLTLAELAVDGFFVLSGFLIIQSWQYCPSFIAFFQKRVLRIYPGFVVASIFSALVVGPLGATGEGYFSHFDFPRFVTGILLLQMPATPPVFSGSAHQLVNGSLWTISYEFRCYLIVALLGVAGLFKWRHLWLALIALAFAIVAIIFYLPSSVIEDISFPGSNLVIGSLPEFARFLLFFGAGGCFYLYREYSPCMTKWSLAALPVSLLCMFQMTLAHLALATIGSALLFWFAFTRFSILNWFKAHSDISYGVYLYGWPMQKLLLWQFPFLAPVSVFFPACALSALCGLLSWRLVEAPFLRLKPHLQTYNL
jgi:peptidoglycan/LPS O-acetylase OafA/YrhL